MSITDDVLRSTAEDTAHRSLQPEQLAVLYVSSVVVGALSLVSTIVAVTSFLRMRRSFRHDLILLLILSDMLKTLWLVILPAIELVHGAILSTSTFCQISGYFLSAGIEACDLAVLLMAVHTGLYIFRGRSGLYPYRHYAYITVAGVSLTLASLAFLNRPAFVNSGPYCYLPTQPDWTNKALSWIPRYVVVATILLTYTCIYIYVRCAMTNVDDPGKFRNANGPYRIDGHQVQEQGPAGPAIQSPPIAYHGLIPPTPPCEGILTDYGLDGTAAGSPNAPLTQSQCVQVLPQAGRENGRQKPGPKSPLESDACCAGGASLLPIHEYRPFSEFERSIYCLTSDEQCASTSRLRVSTPHKIFCQRLACTTKSISQRESAPESNSQVPESCHELVSLPGLALSPTTMNTTGRLKMRDKMRRQVGRLFVYPLVYMTGWLIPFVSHVLGGDNTERPFWLILAGLISLCIQGMADSLVFLLMEKPWRSWITDESLFCLIRWNQQSATKGNNTRVGRTGEEMPIDGIIARKRRKQEEAERRQGPGQPASAPNSREWWDTTLASIDEPSGEEDVEATHPGANNQSRFWP